MSEPIQITFETDEFLIVDKPHNMFVHPTNLNRQEKVSVIGELSKSLGHPLFAVHRLDRPTSGCLLLAKDRRCVGPLSSLFSERKVHKRYLAFVRGTMTQVGTLDYALKHKTKTSYQEASTSWKLGAKAEINIAIPPHETARYSFVELEPHTGRWHQLRRHCAHLRHPIIGDTSHGDARHNRLFRAEFGNRRLLLHASTLSFTNPFGAHEEVIGAAVMPDLFSKVLKKFKFTWIDENQGHFSAFANTEAQLTMESNG